MFSNYKKYTAFWIRNKLVQFEKQIDRENVEVFLGDMKSIVIVFFPKHWYISANVGYDNNIYEHTI